MVSNNGDVEATAFLFTGVVLLGGSRTSGRSGRRPDVVLG